MVDKSRFREWQSSRPIEGMYVADVRSKVAINVGMHRSMIY